MANDHMSDSTVQRNAEAAIINSLAESLGTPGALKPKRVAVPGGAFVELDASSDDDSVLVEAYARQGRLQGAQLKKVSQDILKLAFLKGDKARSASRAVIVFASEEACASITGWVRAAADHFRVELLVVDIPESVRVEIRAAQARLVMVNLVIPADEVADDVEAPSG